MRTLTCELQNKIGQTIKLQGWLHRVRNLGKIAFVILRDRSGLVQCVANTKEINIKGVKIESVVEIIGEVCKNDIVEKGIEVLIKELNIISEVKDDLPIEINKENVEANLDAILNNRVLSIRNPKVNALFKIQAALAQGFSGYLKSQSFTEIFTPKIVAEGTEGGTELFEVKYFDRKAYLAQSPQFYKQMMVGAGYERVFETGHVYRAESHDTQRHVNEFVSLDLEIGFIQDERDIMKLETEMLINIFERIKKECSEELKLLNVNIPEINGEIPSMRLPDAIRLMRERYNKTDLEKDIDPEGERLICQYAKEELGSEFIFLTHYPQSKRPMYTMPAEDGLTHSFDLIFRGVEITTGGQRIHNYEQLKSSIAERGMNPESFNNYLEVFKYGMPPHGGLAIGLERLTAQLIGLSNVREATLFTRDRFRIKP